MHVVIVWFTNFFIFSTKNLVLLNIIVFAIDPPTFWVYTYHIKQTGRRFSKDFSKCLNYSLKYFEQQNGEFVLITFTTSKNYLYL